jgi:beta-lactamase class A
MVFKFKAQTEQQTLPGVPPFKKRERKESRGDGRKAIVVLFIITVFASLLFYLQAELPQIWKKVTAPAIISSLPQGTSDTRTVIKQIKDLTQPLNGTYGVYVYRLEDGREYGVNEDQIFPAASLNKLPVMMAAYQQAEKGKIDLETRYTLKEGDKVEGAGLMQNKPAGSQYSYRQLIEYMAQNSDNTAFKIIRQIVGEDIVEQMTPRQVGEIFQKLYQGELINQEDKEELLQFLTKTSFEDRIPQGVPENIRVAHKIGTLTGVYSDAGIVYGKKPFVLVIMTKNAQEKQALEVLPKITQVVWDFENNH